jgi:transcriptional repressor NrdR
MSSARNAVISGPRVPCIKCGHEHTRCIDTRPAPEMKATRRRRECMLCRQRFTTYEIAAAEIEKLTAAGARTEARKIVNGLIDLMEAEEPGKR